MKLTSEMNRKGYVGNVRQRTETFDKELRTTYASELTLAEKQKRSRRQDSCPSNEKTKETKAGKTYFETTFWIVGILATLVVFINSKTGRENIKRVVTDCGRPTPIQFGLVTVNEQEGTKYGSTASVVCFTGFTSSKPETKCQANGKWSQVYCHVTDCGEALPAIKNGHLTINKGHDTTYGAMATVLCAPGYQRNKHTVSCKADGLWDDALCQPINCGIPEIEHGHLEMESTKYLSQANVKCDSGYAPRQPTVTCSASRVWQNAHCYNIDDCLPNPCHNGGECVDKVADFTCQCKKWYSGKTCDIINCGEALPAIKNGHLTLNKEHATTYGSMATVTCAPGYQRNKHTVSCKADGLWEDALCQPVNCGEALPAIKNGHLTINKEHDTTYGAIATVTCALGYQRNKHTVSCKADGLWEDALCQPINCGNPKIEHGHLEMERTVYLSQAKVKCDHGYAPSQPTVTCTVSRVWQNAQCYNIDDCLPNPCLNKGECVDKVADFTCQCKQWYSGKTCETVYGPCAKHQCRNGGECVPLPNGRGYKCNCPKGIDGNFCESPHRRRH